VSPPISKAAVCVPNDPPKPLAVFTLLSSVQLEPFQDSVSFLAGGAGTPA
jgi:hypothetical protein